MFVATGRISALQDDKRLRETLFRLYTLVPIRQPDRVDGTEEDMGGAVFPLRIKSPHLVVDEVG